MLKPMAMFASGLLLATAGYSTVDITSFTSDHVEGELLVTFAEGLSEAEQDELIAETGAIVIKRFKSSPTVLVKTAETASPQMLDAAFVMTRSMDVTRVGLHHKFKISATPNDPNMRRQYQYDLIGARDAWDITTGSKDVIVGVIDTGINYDHPDLIDNLWTNPGESGLDANGNDKRSNGIDDDGNGYVDDFRGWDFAENDNDPLDDHGHGTHCAGSIGASGNNGEGIAGLNWEVSLVGLRFITARGEGDEGDAIEAIEYATMMGFDLTSNSWGGDGQLVEDDPLYKAIAAAGAAGHLFIAASGNDGRDTDRRPTFPASYDLENIISVGASDRRDRMTGFSNYGATTVDIIAPGSNVYSTTKRGWFGRQYQNMSGTSMAAPIVAGAAALILSEFPDESPAEVKSRILNGVDRINAGKGKLSTEGRLNVFKALTQ